MLTTKESIEELENNLNIALKNNNVGNFILSCKAS
jgi:hypothetical protein